jgi:hypothetical protein
MIEALRKQNAELLDKLDQLMKRLDAIEKK